MTFRILPEARDELFAAALNYEDKEPGLGVRFRREVTAVLDRIVAEPCLWRERAEGYRRVNLPVFPYFIAYFIRDETVIVAAIGHARRKPHYWRMRKS